jgi:predicted DNA-binding transcriptional regulator AlpA
MAHKKDLAFAAFGARRNTGAKAPAIPLTMPGRYRTEDVLAVAAFSRATLYTRIASGKFPPGKRDGGRRYWSTDEVRNALGL